ncbi:AbiV family abortive infection protein [Streptomyces sp. NPDC059340]|uniref:AbiV family abortive infection protein n=1 Tax=Streptomyces sp. NPDC059340 TaxID=3346806 RepID=UPI0036B07D88
MYGGLYITGIGGSGDDDAYPAALRQLAAAAQGNAADLAAEARILLEASRFARAHALATLALEELGKEALCHEALAGKPDERGFRQAWSNHLAKLERSAWKPSSRPAPRIESSAGTGTTRRSRCVACTWMRTPMMRTGDKWAADDW